MGKMTTQQVQARFRLLASMKAAGDKISQDVSWNEERAELHGDLDEIYEDIGDEIDKACKLAGRLNNNRDLGEPLVHRLSSQLSATLQLAAQMTTTMTRRDLLDYRGKALLTLEDWKFLRFKLKNAITRSRDL